MLEHYLLTALAGALPAKTLFAKNYKRESDTMRYKTRKIAGINVFYREAGKPGAPKLLLLGGFPSSSHQWRELMPALADQFHLISPDYPGFGNTDLKDPKEFAYTFDHLAEIVEELEAPLTSSMES